MDQSVLEPNDGVMFRLPPLLRSRQWKTELYHPFSPPPPFHLLYTPLFVDQAAAHSRSALLHLM